MLTCFDVSGCNIVIFIPGSERRICVLDDEVNSLESGPCFRATGDVVKVAFVYLC